MTHINKGLNGKALLLYFLCVVSFILALFSKENAVTLPFALLLTEFFFIRDKQGVIFKNHLIIFCSTLAVIVITAILIRGLPRESMIISRSTYLITEFNVIIRYILMLILPIRQNIDHDIVASVSIFGVKEITSLALILGLLYLGYYLFNKNRLLSFGIFWFFLTLSVESTVIPITDYMFEHRVYLPSFGFFIAVIAALFYLKDVRFGKRMMPAGILVLILLIIPYGVAAYMRNSVWKSELSLWTDSIKKSPKNSRAYCNRGSIFYSEKKYDKAFEDFNKAIALDLNYEYAYYNRGIALMNDNKNSEAINDFTKAIQLKTDFVEAFFNRGFIFSKLGKYDKAILDFTKAIELNPTYSEAYNKRGVNFMNWGKYDLALKDFNKAIELNPTYAEAYSNRGFTFEKEGKSDSALIEFNKAIDLAPTYAMAFNNRGIFFMNKKMFEKALTDFNKAIQLNPGFAEAFINRGKVLSSENRNDEAVNEWNKAIQLNPGFTLAYYNRGTILMNENKNAEALNDFDKTIELKPDFAEAYLNRGAILFKEKRYEEAINSFTKAITYRPDYAEAYFNRGVNEYYSGKKDAACTDWKQAAALGYKPAADALLQRCK